jgi:hypothetical protein
VDNNQLLLATPLLWYPGQSEADFHEEVELMLARTQITSSFLRGEIYPDTFLDFLDKQGFDVFELAEDWQLILP